MRLGNALACVLFVGAFAPALAAAQPFNTNGTSLAIGGYDPVAYFTDRRARQGSADHEHRWGGATWRFATAEHLAAFRANPSRYAPQFGGYCAYAMARGDAVRIDPQAWSVVGGKLYLNYSRDIRSRWNEDRDDYIRRARDQWPRVRRSL